MRARVKDANFIIAWYRGQNWRVGGGGDIIITEWNALDPGLTVDVLMVAGTEVEVEGGASGDLFFYTRVSWQKDPIALSPDWIDIVSPEGRPRMSLPFDEDWD